MANGGGLAIAVLIILGFAGFVLWAKTPRGKQTLRESFGEPNAGAKKRTPAPRKRPASRANPPAPKTAARPTAAKTPPDKQEKASGDRAQTVRKTRR